MCMFYHLYTIINTSIGPTCSHSCVIDHARLPTTDGLKFVSMKHTDMILPPMHVCSLFRVFFRIVNVLAQPIILSTWIIFAAFRLSPAKIPLFGHYDVLASVSEHLSHPILHVLRGTFAEH